jgi:ribosomal protein S12 methylthiotransferase accessory factor
MAGITRVSEITGLDRSGIPVAQCVRPDAVSLCVDSGKGATREAALCSAMMEGFERHVGETARVESITETGARLKSVETRFQLLKGGFYNPNMPIEWTTMTGLYSGNKAMVPLACVKMIPIQLTYPLFKSMFYSNSNGLSSGNTLDEAVAGGLYEVIERDQVAIAFSKDIEAQRVDLDTIEDSTLGGLVERLRSNDIMPIILDCTLDIGIPTYICYLYDTERGTGIYKGYATHLNPEVAQCRAVCEAVQGRVVFMSGSRDDISHKKFVENKTKDNNKTMEGFFSFKKTVSSKRHEDMSTDSFVGDIAKILKKLHKLNIPEPLIKAFDHPYPCSVVKVAIPTLEGYYNKYGQTGERGRK